MVCLASLPYCFPLGNGKRASIGENVLQFSAPVFIVMEFLIHTSEDRSIISLDSSANRSYLRNSQVVSSNSLPYPTSFSFSCLVELNLSASSFSFIMASSSNFKDVLLSNPKPNAEIISSSVAKESSPSAVEALTVFPSPSQNGPPSPPPFLRLIFWIIFLKSKRTLMNYPNLASLARCYLLPLICALSLLELRLIGELLKVKLTI